MDNENEHFSGKLIFYIITCLLLFIFVQYQTLYAQSKKDSLQRVMLFGIQHQPISPLQSPGDSLKISLNYKSKLNDIMLYDPKTLMPADPLKLDYRHHPYYTPKVVDDFINMNIMNRPPSSSFVSLPTLALLAASVAVQYAAVKLKMQLSAQDYLLEDKYYPILSALWEKSPQTAEELYRLPTVHTGRSMRSLKNDLLYLIDKRLIKTRKIPEGSTKYFPAQKKEDVIRLLEQSAAADSSRGQQWVKLKQVLTN